MTMAGSTRTTSESILAPAVRSLNTRAAQQQHCKRTCVASNSTQLTARRVDSKCARAKLQSHRRATQQRPSPHALTLNYVRSVTAATLGRRIVTARSEMRKVLFLTPSVCGFCLCMKYLGEPLNESVPNSRGRRVWSLARTSLKVKVKGDF